MKPRIKMHQMPGDLPKKAKIQLLEGRAGKRRQQKTFRRMLRMRERAVLKRQAVWEIERARLDGFLLGE